MQSLHSFAKRKAAFFAPLILIYLVLSDPLVVTAQDTIDREIVVMFKPDVIRMPLGQIRAPITAVNMPTRIRDLLQNLGAREIALGIPSFQKSDTLRILSDGRVFRLPDYTNLFVVLLAQADRRPALVDSLHKLPEVVSAEKNQKAILRELVPNDTHFTSRQWNMKNTGQFGGTSGADIKATLAWDFTTGSSSVILGFVDTGIQANHGDLTGRVSGDAGFGDFHGTHVAGIAGATGNNSQGVAGVDWNAQLVSQRFDVLGGIPGFIQGVNDAVAAGARVINNSWGLEDYSEALYNAFLAAQQADVLSIVANPENGAEGEFPNNFGAWIFNVGATTNGNAKASYSFDRNYTDVAAPGGNADADVRHDILSTVTYNTALGPYDYAFGTSMAAPHATGIAGLLLSINPSLHNYDLDWIIKRSANDIDPPGRDPSTGYGRVNAYEAVRHVAAPYQITHGDATLSITNSNTKMTFLSSPGQGLASGVYWCDRYKLEAVLSFSYTEVPWAWVSQTAFSSANPNDASEYHYENSTTTSTTVRTWFYFVRKNSGGYTINKWVPWDPNLFPKKYAVLGIPGTPPLSVGLFGDTYLIGGTTGNWDASVSGGTGSYTYDWYYRLVGGTWSPVRTVTTSSIIDFYSRTAGFDDFELKVEVTSGAEFVVDDIFVDVCVGDNCPLGPGGAKQAIFEDEETLPETYSLAQNYPNPFNPQTEILFTLPEATHVSISVYDVTGREVVRLIDRKKMEAGYHRVKFDAPDLPSGVYLYRIMAGDYVAVKRMTLMK